MDKKLLLKCPIINHKSSREFCMMKLETSAVEEKQLDLSSLQSQSSSDTVSRNENGQDDFTTPRRQAKFKWPARNTIGNFAQSGAALRSFVLPSPNLKPQTGSFHRERRKTNYTKKNKEQQNRHHHHHHRRRHPFSLYDDEESAFDADVDESDSTLEVNKTTVTTATSKTSSMSLGYTTSSFLRDKLRQEELVTPPRGFIRSFGQIECSPLSLSFQSSPSSSISGDYNRDLVEVQEENMEDIEKKWKSIKTIPKTLYVKKFCERGVVQSSEEVLPCGQTPTTRFQLAELPKDCLQGFSSTVTKGFKKVKLSQTSFKKSKRTVRLSKIIRFLMAQIVIYSTSSIVFTTLKLHHDSSDGGGERLKELQIFTSIEPWKNDSSMSTTTTNNINRRFNRRATIFKDSNERIAIKRTLGGLQPIYNFEEEAKPFDKLDQGRSRGLGELKIEMYHKDDRGEKMGSHPKRVFHFDETKGSAEHHHIVRELTLYPTVFSDNTQLYGIRDSDDPALVNMEPLVDDESSECVPMADWQSTYYPLCNGMHELDIVNLESAKLVGKKGYWRNAWRIDLMGGDFSEEMETLILKTPKFDHNFEQAYYEHDRVDAQAMERLTFSPHVINIYGHCGRSVMSEFADGPRLGTLADKSKKHPLKRLKIARDIAQGLSHVHFGRGDENASFVHLDVNPANIVVVNNTLKVNDFNIGIMLKRNSTSGLQCGFPAQFPNPQWRSPEEANESPNLTEKVDVFSMGHIFFRMICGHEPWNKLEVGGKPSSATLREKVMLGMKPRIPDSILNTSNPEEKVIRDAMLACYTVDPEERPSSRDVAEFLEYELSKLSRGGKYKLAKKEKK